MKIPNNIGDLDYLRELNLDENLINNLPDNITDLDSLRILRLNKNLLNVLPDNIGGLTPLEELYLSRNQLTSIPESIGNLNNLKKLFIIENLLISLPATICDLPDNCNIQIRDNCLNGSYECISNMGDQTNCPALEIVDYQPNLYQLFEPYPNPFNPAATLSFSLSEQGFTSIQIADLNGRLVETPVHQFMVAGYYSIDWDGSQNSSGVYLIRMMLQNQNSIEKSYLIQTRKMVLLK